MGVEAVIPVVRTGAGAVGHVTTATVICAGEVLTAVFPCHIRSAPVSASVASAPVEWLDVAMSVGVVATRGLGGPVTRCESWCGWCLRFSPVIGIVSHSLVYDLVPFDL